MKTDLGQDSILRDINILESFFNYNPGKLRNLSDNNIIDKIVDEYFDNIIRDVI